MEHLTHQPKNQPKNRDELVVNWYEKELNKDRKELEVSKHQYINLLKTVDKTKKNDATGQYEPTGETREENEIDKLFRASDRMTTAEIRAKAAEASFAFTWETKNTGVTKNKSKGAPAGTGTAGMPMMSPGVTKKPATSLFG